MQLEGKASFSIAEACQSARLSRSGFYRHFEEHLVLSHNAPLRWTTASTPVRRQAQP